MSHSRLLNIVDAIRDIAWGGCTKHYMPCSQARAILALVRDRPDEWQSDTNSGAIIVSALPSGFIDTSRDGWRFANSSLLISISSVGDVYIYPDMNEPCYEIAKGIANQIRGALGRIRWERGYKKHDTIIKELHRA